MPTVSWATCRHIAPINSTPRLAENDLLTGLDLVQQVEQINFQNGIQETVHFNERLQPDAMEAVKGSSLWKLENFYCPGGACTSNNGNVADSPAIDHSFSSDSDQYSSVADQRGRSEATLAF